MLWNRFNKHQIADSFSVCDLISVGRAFVIDSIGLKQNNINNTTFKINFCRKLVRVTTRHWGALHLLGARTQRGNHLSILLGNRQNPGYSFTFPRRNQLSNRGETWRPPNHCRSCHVPELGVLASKWCVPALEAPRLTLPVVRPTCCAMDHVGIIY